MVSLERKKTWKLIYLCLGPNKESTYTTCSCAPNDKWNLTVLFSCQVSQSSTQNGNGVFLQVHLYLPVPFWRKVAFFESDQLSVQMENMRFDKSSAIPTCPVLTKRRSVTNRLKNLALDTRYLIGIKDRVEWRKRSQLEPHNVLVHEERWFSLTQGKCWNGFWKLGSVSTTHFLKVSSTHFLKQPGLNNIIKTALVQLIIPELFVGMTLFFQSHDVLLEKRAGFAIL